MSGLPLQMPFRQESHASSFVYYLTDSYVLKGLFGNELL